MLLLKKPIYFRLNHRSLSDIHVAEVPNDYSINCQKENHCYDNPLISGNRLPLYDTQEKAQLVRKSLDLNGTYVLLPVE